VRARLRAAARLIAPSLCGLALGLGLFGLGLAGPSVGMAAAEVTGPPRRPPVMPPAVPPGAPEHLAFFSYVEKINQAWGRDWPTVIRFFEEFDARYPGNPVVRDKLYAAYLEHAKELWRHGDFEGARAPILQARDYDPDRGVAQELLGELDQVAGTRRGR
jgi:hypothetical protein